MKVLVVEDNEVLRMQLVRALKQKGRYVVDDIGDGEEALYRIQNWPYNLILLDIALPGVDGLQILAAVRKKISTPILLLTAQNRVAERVRGLDLGADDYLTKPFEMDELLARVRSSIRRSRQTPDPLLEMDGFTINTNSGKVFSSEKVEVPMTRAEYSILLHLATQAGKIVSSVQLLDAISRGGYDDSASNTLHVHVFNIRRKLGKDVIKTYRGRGFLVNDANHLREAPTC